MKTRTLIDIPVDTSFDLDQARADEVDRRLKMLGNLADQEYDYDGLRQRARETLVPIPVLKDWWEKYRTQAADGLIPDWSDLNAESWTLAKQLIGQLQPLCDQEVISKTEIENLAGRLHWTFQRTRRWLRRYRIGGLAALSPSGNPIQTTNEKMPPRDLGALNDKELEVVYQRRAILGPLAQIALEGKLSNSKIRERLQELHGDQIRSERTLWNYARQYRRYQIPGLAPRVRSDKGKYHEISEEMVKLVEAIRFSHRDIPIRSVWEKAGEVARKKGEATPSFWQVRTICNRIPKPQLLLADGRENEFRNSYRFTHPIRFDASRVVYQLDSTMVDLEVIDLRHSRLHNKEGYVRPWLTLVIDSRSRLVMAAHFSYDRPDQFIVAAAIRDSLLISEKKPFGGRPNELWVDNGREMVSRYVQQLIRELDIKLNILPPHQPQQKGIVERFFGTLNTELWRTLPGYSGPDFVAKNPMNKAELTLSQVEERFWEFIEKYHRRIHSETSLSPLEYWERNCFAEQVDDPRLLDLLLLEPIGGSVSKQGIKVNSRIYWHEELATLVGERVVIRSAPAYEAPDEIEVYYGGHWICTAIADDSDAGMKVTRQQVARAQQRQRNIAKHRIQTSRQELEKSEAKIEERGEKPISLPPAKKSKSSPSARVRTPKRRGWLE